MIDNFVILQKMNFQTVVIESSHLVNCGEATLIFRMYVYPTLSHYLNNNLYLSTAQDTTYTKISLF